MSSQVYLLLHSLPTTTEVCLYLGLTRYFETCLIHDRVFAETCPDLPGLLPVCLSFNRVCPGLPRYTLTYLDKLINLASGLKTSNFTLWIERVDCVIWIICHFSWWQAVMILQDGMKIINYTRLLKFYIIWRTLRNNFSHNIDSLGCCITIHS